MRSPRPANARPSVVGRTWGLVADQLIAHYMRVPAARESGETVVALKTPPVAKIRGHAS